MTHNYRLYIDPEWRSKQLRHITNETRLAITRRINSYIILLIMVIGANAINVFYTIEKWNKQGFADFPSLAMTIIITIIFVPPICVMLIDNIHEKTKDRNLMAESQRALLENRTFCDDFMNLTQYIYTHYIFTDNFTKQMFFILMYQPDKINIYHKDGSQIIAVNYDNMNHTKTFICHKEQFFSFVNAGHISIHLIDKLPSEQKETDL